MKRVGARWAAAMAGIVAIVAMAALAGSSFGWGAHSDATSLAPHEDVGALGRERSDARSSERATAPADASEPASARAMPGAARSAGAGAARSAGAARGAGAGAARSAADTEPTTGAAVRSGAAPRSAAPMLDGDAGVRMVAAAPPPSPSAPRAEPSRPEPPPVLPVLHHPPTPQEQLERASRVYDYIILRRDDVRRRIEELERSGDRSELARLRRELAGLDESAPDAHRRVEEYAAELPADPPDPAPAPE